MGNSLRYQQAPHASVTPRATSYFSAPEKFLDPRLFDDNNQMHPEVENDLKGRFDDHMGARFQNHQAWSKVWLAGSGASYQWSAARDPGDLDMLVGIDYPECRRHNQVLARLGDVEISRYVTSTFNSDLSPTTAQWSPSTHPDSTYEVTWYANPNSTDIRKIRPYAAYQLGAGTWDVEPDANPYRPSYLAQADSDKTMTQTILSRYTAAQEGLQNRNLPPYVRRSHQDALKNSLEQAAALFDDIHDGRHAAFSHHGKGYADPANARWQAGKESGVVPALKVMRDFLQNESAALDIAMYGVELPDADDLILRALVVSNQQ